MSVDNDSERSTRYEGYADYASISRQVATLVEESIRAWSKIQRYHQENYRVSAKQASDAGHHILSAAIRLRPELEQDRDDVEFYDEILERWNGENGFIKQLQRTSLTQSCPAFLEDFVTDITDAGFRLGYIQAGEQRDDENVSWKDGDITDMVKKS